MLAIEVTLKVGSVDEGFICATQAASIWSRAALGCTDSGWKGGSSAGGGSAGVALGSSHIG